MKVGASGLWTLQKPSPTFALEKGEDSQSEAKCTLPDRHEGHTYQRGKDRSPPNSFPFNTFWLHCKLTVISVIICPFGHTSGKGQVLRLPPGLPACPSLLGGGRLAFLSTLSVARIVI